MNKISIFIIATGLYLGSCCNEDFIIPGDPGGDYDFIEYAIDITPWVAPGNNCSPTNAYTTVGATPDENPGTCWGPSPATRHNRWFRFTASSTGLISLTVMVVGTGGTQLRTYAALWDSSGDELTCGWHDNDNGDVSIYHDTLTPGQVYYLSVDVADDDGVGTFGLCLTDSV
jgi:hypothetical protein